jgi:hypothetical protein
VEAVEQDRAQSGKVMVGHLMDMELEELVFLIMVEEAMEHQAAEPQLVPHMEQVIFGQNFI